MGLRLSWDRSSIGRRGVMLPETRQERGFAILLFTEKRGRDVAWEIYRIPSVVAVRR